MRALAVAVFVLASSALPASASCEVALQEVARGRLVAAEAALGWMVAHEADACALYAWGRIAEARGEHVRASVLYRRALASAEIVASDETPASAEIVARGEIEARERQLPASARQVAEGAEDVETLTELGPVPTLAMLREITRASMESYGWYPLGNVACRVEQRVHVGALEVAVVRVTADRVMRDEELRVAVRDPDGWRYVAEVGPQVASGQELRGALELVGLEASGRSFVARARSWASEDGTVPPWRTTIQRCTRHGSSWRCSAR